MTIKDVNTLYDNFEKKYKGKPVDYDGVAGVQCVDLADQYLKDCFGITGVWVTGARDLYNKFSTYPALVKAFTKIENTRALVVEKGDIVIWGGGTWGHVAIGNGEGNIDWFISLEQNTLGRHEPAQLVKHYFNNKSGNDGCWPVLGVLRPKTTAIKGDVNGDGEVNVADINAIASHLKGVKKLNNEEQKNADINGDGKIDVSDISDVAATIKGIK